MAADNINYKDALIITGTKVISSGIIGLDVPFEIYSCVAVSNNRFAKLEEGKTYLANINYKIEDEASVFAFSGYVSDFKNDSRVLTYWDVIKADYFATFNDDGDEIKYNGADKDELAPFCISNVMS